MLDFYGRDIFLSVDLIKFYGITSKFLTIISNSFSVNVYRVCVDVNLWL